MTQLTKPNIWVKKKKKIFEVVSVATGLLEERDSQCSVPMCCLQVMSSGASVHLQDLKPMHSLTAWINVFTERVNVFTERD